MRCPLLWDLSNNRWSGGIVWYIRCNVILLVLIKKSRRMPSTTLARASWSPRCCRYSYQNSINDSPRRTLVKPCDHRVITLEYLKLSHVSTTHALIFLPSSRLLFCFTTSSFLSHFFYISLYSTHGLAQEPAKIWQGLLEIGSSSNGHYRTPVPLFPIFLSCCCCSTHQVGFLGRIRVVANIQFLRQVACERAALGLNRKLLTLKHSAVNITINWEFKKFSYMEPTADNR